MKKNRLILSKDYPIDVFGVSSSLKRHKFAWQLGHSLAIEFLRIADLYADLDSQNRFSCFKNKSEEYERCYIVENKNNGHFYHSKFTVADFFVIVYKDESKLPLENIDKSIKALEGVQLVFPIDIEKEATKNVFLFD